MTERANEKDPSLAALTPPGAPKPQSGEGGPSADRAQDPLGVGGWTLGVPPAPDEEASTRRFVPGYVFAERYRMITRLGTADGEVWRADIYVQTPVALKLIHSTSEKGRQRILNEVRSAGRLLPGSMPCVRRPRRRAGSSTPWSVPARPRTLLRRVGRLPAEKSSTSSSALCRLAAAHAQGVLPGNLKRPMCSSTKRSVRLPIRIAITTEDTGPSRLGTPGYMSPEH